MSFGTQLAMQTGSAAAGDVIGMALSPFNDNRQLTQQRKLNNLQVQEQEQLGNFNYDQQMKLWNATNYAAQVGQMNKAGINPGLLYSNGGGGGTTQAVGAGKDVAGGQAQQNPGESTAGMAMMSQVAMMQAQKDLMKAQTRDTNADAANKETVIPENIKSSTGLNIANTGNAEADTQLKKVETDIAGIQKQIQGATIEEQIQTITAEMRKAQETVEQMEIKTFIDRATKNTIVDQIKANLINTYIDNNLERAQIGLTNAQTGQANSQTEVNKQEVHNLTEEVLQKWQMADNDTDRNKIQKNYTEKLIDLGVGAEVIEGVGTILGAVKGGGIPRGTTPPPVKGFKQW